MDKIKYDSEYISYIESGESAAVFITRDIVKSINTQGKWIDIVIIDAFDYWDDYEDYPRKDFNYFIVELFPRKTKPVYPKGISDNDKKYITWKTANDDISKQRKDGYIGERYLIFAKLYKKRIYKGTTMALYNTRFQRFVPDKWKTSSTEYRKKKIFETKWDYSIKTVKRINSKQFKYIYNNLSRIDDLIESENCVKLSYFRL